MPPRFFKPLVANMLLFLFFVPAAVRAESAAQGVIMALSAAPKTLDSRYSVGGTSTRLLRLLSLPLVQLDAAFNPAPAAALTFTEAEGNALIFTLAPLVFVDGSPFTATDVKNFYDSIRDPSSASPFKGALDSIKEVEVLSQHEVKFTFHAAIPPFVWRLFENPIIKVNSGLEGRNVAHSPIGLGPYVASSGADLANLTFTLSPYWQGPKPASPILTFKTVKDPLVRLLKVLRGEAHILQNDMPAVFLNYAKTNTHLRVLTAPSTNYTYLGFNFADSDLKKLAVRQALAYAINQEEIVKTLLFGLARPAQSLLGEEHPAFWPAPIVPYDPAKAVALLDEAGYVPNAQGTRLTLGFSTTNDPSTLLFVQAIAAQLKKVGVNLKINTAEWGSFYGNVLKGNFQLYLLTWVGTFDADIYRNLFHSSQQPPYGANRGRFKNAEVDALIETLFDPTTPVAMRLETAKHIQQKQAELLLYVPLWQRHNVALLHPKVEGFELSADSSYDGLLKTYLRP